MIQIDRKDIYRYLGYRRNEPEEDVCRAVEECVNMLQEAVTPRYVSRRYPVETVYAFSAGNPDRSSERYSAGNLDRGSERYSAGNPDRSSERYLAGNTDRSPERDPVGKTLRNPAGNSREQLPVLRIAGMEIRSRSLAKNLRGCREVYLMAATLGLGPDRLIARESVKRMSRAVILQAAAAAMIESWCDSVNRKIIREASAEGLYCRPRFSPGYGDFSLEFQRDFAQSLRLQKEIGVSLTESLLMMPSKSVTAVIGLSPERAGCVMQGCEACEKAADCAFSRVL